eukprot:809588-Pyramimonas_sp.AAC.1
MLLDGPRRRKSAHVRAMPSRSAGPQEVWTPSPSGGLSGPSRFLTAPRPREGPQTSALRSSRR